MTAQDVITQVSMDMRQVLSAASPDNLIILPWVDRIQKDCLHTGLYNFLLHVEVGLNVTVGNATYDLPLGEGLSLRRILSVYDRTFDRVLLPYESLGLPSTKADAEPGQPSQIPMALMTAETNSQYPLYYKRYRDNSIALFPAPQKAAFNGAYEVQVEAQVDTLASTSVTLLLPDDALDMIVAGVNSLAAAYLKNPEDYQAYKAQYESMKSGAYRG